MRSKIKNDIFLAAGIILAAMISALVFNAFARDGAFVRVTVDGEEYGRYPLEKNGEYVISTEYGENVLKIENGKADIISATCPDGLCVDHYAISRDGEAIICIPNRLAAEICEEDSSNE